MAQQQQHHENDIELPPRPYDIIVFGACGVVGAAIVEELALVTYKFFTHLHEDNEDGAERKVSRRTIKWAIAGRSAWGLQKTLFKTKQATGIQTLSTDINIILADLNHYKSMLEMCSQTTCMINCAGPYFREADSLIETCVHSKTHYIDLAQEEIFIESVRQKYSQLAKEAGTYIINGCGFNSMSAEMGLNYAKQVADGHVEEVKIILCVNSADGQTTTPSDLSVGITPGMWSSLLIHISNSGKLKKHLELMQRDPDIDGESIARRKDGELIIKDLIKFRNDTSSMSVWRLLISFFIHNSFGYCLPLGGLSGDDFQLIRGAILDFEQRQLDLPPDRLRPVRCTSYLSLASFTQLCFASLWLLLFRTFAKFKLTRYLISTFPSIVTFGLVKPEKQHDTSTLCHIKYSQTFIIYGTPTGCCDETDENRRTGTRRKSEKLLVARVSGPEPNRLATACFATQAALALVTSDKTRLPKSGGVMTPLIAFANTDIIEMLKKRNFKFETLRKT